MYCGRAKPEEWQKGVAGLILFIGAKIGWSVVSRWQARQKSCKMMGMIFFQMEQLTDIGGKSRSTVLILNQRKHNASVLHYNPPSSNVN